MSTTRTALLAGATGLVGGFCLQELLESDAYGSVVAVVRRPLGREHPKLRVVQTEFDRMERVGHEFRADHVFCCLGTTIARAGSREAFHKVDAEYTLRLARVCRQQGATLFALVSSLGANPDSPFFYTRVKGETERALAREGYFTVLIFRPSLLLGERSEPRPRERVAQLAGRGLAWALTGRFRKYQPVEARVVARAMVRLAASASFGTHVFESDRIAAEASRG